MMAVLLAAASPLTVNDGDEVTISVAAAGVTIRMPEFVRVVTPSANYEIRPLAQPKPPAAPGAAAAPAQSPQDVRVFLVRPLRPGAGEQPVTFLMAEDRSLTVRFVASVAGTPEESFVDVRWVKRTPASAQRATAAGDQFLGAERTLLTTMLRDEHALGWKVALQPVPLSGYPDLEVTLVRTYETDGLTGAVYLARNRSSATVELNQTVLALGKPNRAVLTQMDHSELRSCKEDDSLDPRGTGCVTVIRIVSRSGTAASTLRVERGVGMPFLLSAKEKGGERR